MDNGQWTMGNLYVQEVKFQINELTNYGVMLSSFEESIDTKNKEEKSKKIKYKMRFLITPHAFKFDTRYHSLIKINDIDEFKIKLIQHTIALIHHNVYSY